MWSIKNLFKKNEWIDPWEVEDEEDFFEDNMQEKDKEYDFPILRSEAIKIANENENLKTDFCRQYKRNITYLSFRKKKMDLIEKDGKKYWQIQVLYGEISGINQKSYGEEYWDGFLLKRDLEKLRCLIDVETGEYIYYPIN